jgi:hypothetical protein
MFNSFEQFNMNPKSQNPENPDIGSEKLIIKSESAGPIIDQKKESSAPEIQISPKAETSSVLTEKSSSNSDKLIGAINTETLEEKPVSVRTSEDVRSSALSKVVGAPSEEVEKSLLEDSRRIFETQPINESAIKKNFFSSKAFKELERPATPEEAEMIKVINQNMAEFVKRYGGKPLSIGVEQVHFIDDKKINKKITKELNLDEFFGYYSGAEQSVIVSPDISVGKINLLTSKLKRAQSLTHEFMHFNSFQSVQYKPESPDKTRYRRCGIEMLGSDNNIHFRNLNEAITEELAIRFGRKYFNQIPSIQKNLDIIKKEELDLKKDFDEAQKKSASYSAFPDVGSISEDGKIYKHSYPIERRNLGEFIRIIFQRNPGKFQSEEEVFEVFARAYFTGKTLELARLIEKSYPVKGTFRRIGDDEDYYKKSEN